MRRIILGVLATAMVAMASQPADAAIVVGTLNIDGDIVVTGTTIEWEPSGPLVDGDATGLADIGTSTGIFAPLSDCNDCDFQKNLDSTAQPAGEDFTFENFETFDASSSIIQAASAEDLTFTLNRIELCTTCATGFEGTPFNFVQVGTSVFVLMNMSGTWSWASQGYVDQPWIGAWSAQFPGTTIAAVLADLLANGFVGTTFSASKISALAEIPEPTTLLLLGTGSALLAARRRRQSRRA